MARRVSEHGGPSGPLMDCVVLVPMLGRATQVARLVDSLHASTDRARLLFLLSPNDDDVYRAVQGHDYLVIPTPPGRGDYARKINVGIKVSTEPLIFTGAIDLHFHPGWLDIAQAHMSHTVHVVGTNDLANDRTVDTHSTHTLVARDYVQRGLIDGRPGLLCEDYLHEYVDDELVGTARHRGIYAHASHAVVEHLHPIAGKAAWDDSYRAMNLRMDRDRFLFGKRQKLWT